MKQSILKILLILTSLSIFVLSLNYNAMILKDYDGIHVMSSLSCFLMGSTAILGGGILEWIIWFANPLCLIAIFYIIVDNQKLRKFLLQHL